MMPPRVARALRELRLHVGHVGGSDQPPKGSPDEDVLKHASTTNQVIVTIDYGMVLLCVEAGESVVWLDTRGRQLTFEAMVLLAFSRVEEWERLLAEPDAPVCVHALRTKSEALALDRASQLIHGRMRKLKARERQRRRRQAGGDTLLS